MALGTDKVLGPGGVGMLDGSEKLTSAARSKFVTDILGVMAGGNKNGLGLIHTIPPLPLPVFPVAGPKVILNPLLRPEGESFFWFDPEPLSLILAPVLLKEDGEFQKLIVDGLFQPLVKMLNIAGSTSLGPVIDPTIAVDLSKFPNAKLPDLPKLLADIFVQVNLSAPTAPAPGIPAAKLKLFNDFGIGDAKLPDLISLLTSPPDLTPPNFLPPIPPIPIPAAGLSTPNLPDLAAGIFKIPSGIIGQLMPEISSLDFDPLAIIKKIIGIIVKIIMALLELLGIVGLPKLLLSTLMVIIKDLAVMLLCVVIGKLLGTGLIVKIVGSLGGLV